MESITDYYHFVGHCGAFWRILRAKMSLSRAQNIFMPANINSIVILGRYSLIITDYYHFVEKPFQSLLKFYHSAGEKNILQSVLLSFFSVFIFSMSFKVIIIVIEFMLLGINIFWARLRAHFNPHQTARAKMSLSRAQNIYAREHRAVFI